MFWRFVQTAYWQFFRASNMSPWLAIEPVTFEFVTLLSSWLLSSWLLRVFQTHETLLHHQQTVRFPNMAYDWVRGFWVNYFFDFVTFDLVLLRISILSEHVNMTHEWVREPWLIEFVTEGRGRSGTRRESEWWRVHLPSESESESSWVRIVLSTRLF